jgi:hypothetical protein
MWPCGVSMLIHCVAMRGVIIHMRTQLGPMGIHRSDSNCIDSPPPYAPYAPHVCVEEWVVCVQWVVWGVVGSGDVVARYVAVLPPHLCRMSYVVYRYTGIGYIG